MRIQSYREFWDFYILEHRHPLNRRVHFIGTTLAIAVVGVCLWTQNWSWLWLAPLLGYGGAWWGHFRIERNRPATFKYPIWSLLSDFRMWGLMWLGRMEAEVTRVTGSNGSAPKTPQA